MQKNIEQHKYTLKIQKDMCINFLYKIQKIYKILCTKHHPKSSNEIFIKNCVGEIKVWKNIIIAYKF